MNCMDAGLNPCYYCQLNSSEDYEGNELRCWIEFYFNSYLASDDIKHSIVYDLQYASYRNIEQLKHTVKTYFPDHYKYVENALLLK